MKLATIVTMAVMLILGGFASPPAAGEERPEEIVVGDLPGSNGEWQYGRAVILAPADTVQHWLGDVVEWPRRFPDVEWVQVLGTTADGRRTIRFRSSIVGRTMTVRLRQQPGAITYDGEGKNVNTRGRIFVEALDATRARVTIQTTAEVHGLAGLFATKNMKRDRAQRKIQSDLSSLVRLSRLQRERAAHQR